MSCVGLSVHVLEQINSDAKALMAHMYHAKTQDHFKMVLPNIRKLRKGGQGQNRVVLFVHLLQDPTGCDSWCCVIMKLELRKLPARVVQVIQCAGIMDSNSPHLYAL